MIKRKRFLPKAVIALGLGAGLATAGLAEDRDPATIRAGLSTGEWQLLAMNGARVTSQVTFALDAEGKLTGQAPCNRYFGTNEATAPEIFFDAIGATRMLCSQQAEEDSYFETLRLINQADLQDEHLLLLGAEGKVLEFVRDPEAKDLFCLTCGD